MRDIDLTRLGLRGPLHVHPRQEAQLDGLLRQRVGSGDHGLTGDDGRHHGEHDKEQSEARRTHHKEPVLRNESRVVSLRFRQNSERERALTEIIHGERGQDKE